MDNNKLVFRNPKISVIMPVFNHGEYLDESIESIIFQTYKNFEFIIVDDASTDQSSQILKEWMDKDSRIKVITNKENMGLTKSLNRALQIAEGEYIARQDGDDVSLPERFEKQIEFFQAHPEIKILGTFGYIIDKQGNILGKEILATSFQTIKKEFIKRNPLMHTSVMIKKEIIDKMGGYDETFKTSQDYELWARILRIAKGDNLPLFLVKKRYHINMISIKKDRDQLINTIFIQKRELKRGEYPAFYYAYLIKHYISLYCPAFFKIWLKKYFLKKKNVFKKVY